MPKFRVLVLVAACAGGALPWLDAACAQAATVVGSRVHVIYVADSGDPTIGRFIERNMSLFEDLITNQIREERRASYCCLSDNKCTAKRLLAAVDGLVVQPVDTVFLYYQGHGAYAEAAAAGDASQGQFLQLLDERLPRQRLLDQLQRTNPRLVVLMTDCCNVDCAIAVPAKPVFETKTADVVGWTGLEDLLFSYRGVVDVTSSSRGEFSWYSNDLGGWFTSEFLQHMYSLCPQRPVEWKSTWTALSSKTDDLYQRQRGAYLDQHPLLKAQPHMKPTAYRLGAVREDASDAPTTSQQFAYPVWRSVPDSPQEFPAE